MTTLPTRQQIATKSVDVQLAFANSGAIRETDGPNRSELLDKYQSVFGVQGVSYCELGHWIGRLKVICFLVWPNETIDVKQLRRALTFHQQHYGPCPLSCTETIEIYGKRNRWKLLDHKNVAPWMSQIQPGDGLIFDFSTPGHFDRHFETFIDWARDAHGNLMQSIVGGCYVARTVGWNTSPDASSGSQSDGQGCYLRHRQINAHVLGSLDETTE